MSLILLGAGPGAPGIPEPAGAPTIVSVTVEADGVSATVVWNKRVTFVGAGGMNINGDQGHSTLFSSGDGTTTLVFEVNPVVQSDEVLTWEVESEMVIAVNDSTPNETANGSAINNSAIDTAPVLLSAVVPSAGTSLILTWDQAVVWAGGGADVALTGDQTVACTFSSGDGTPVLVFTLSEVVYSGSVLDVEITEGAVEDMSANPNAPITDEVTNQSTRVPNPTIVSGVSGAGALGGTTISAISGLSNGDLIVLGVLTAGNASLAATGWTRHGVVTLPSMTRSIAVYSHVRTGDSQDTTPFASGAAGGYQYIAHGWTKVVGDPEVDDADLIDQESATSLVAPSSDPTVTNTTLLCFFMLEGANQTITLPGTLSPPTVNNIFAGEGTIKAGFQLLSASGSTGTRTATTSPAAAGGNASIALK